MRPAGQDNPLRTEEALVVHASAVALNGSAVLITGASGSGKSTLALQLMGLGATLISDDRTLLRPAQATLMAECPDAIRNLIEARGVGLLRAEAGPPTPVVLVVDMDQHERDRLPEARYKTIAGRRVRCFHKTDSPAFPPAVLQYLKSGMKEPS